MLVSVSHGEVLEDGSGVTVDVLAVTDVGVSAVKKEMSSAIGEDSEASQVGSVAVVELEIV